jgi:hypothetical protein
VQVRVDPDLAKALRGDREADTAVVLCVIDREAGGRENLAGEVLTCARCSG